MNNQTLEELMEIFEKLEAAKFNMYRRKTIMLLIIFFITTIIIGTLSFRSGVEKTTHEFEKIIAKSKSK